MEKFQSVGVGLFSIEMLIVGGTNENKLTASTKNHSDGLNLTSHRQFRNFFSLDHVDGLRRRQDSALDQNLLVHRLDQRAQRDLLLGLRHLLVRRSRDEGVAERQPETENKTERVWLATRLV